MSTRLRRSELSVPASNQHMIEKGVAGDADMVFLDLEDAVAPALKEGARANVVRALRELDWGKKLRAVRVNDAETPWAHGDVIEVLEGAGQNLDVLVLPKVKAPRDVWFFETLVDQLERRLGLERRIAFEALIEEAEALACVEEIARSSPRLEALILGFGDLSASLGFRWGYPEEAELRYPGDPWHAHRVRVVTACRAAGIDAIDGPFADYRDVDTYRREAAWSSVLGFVGKWAIHPSQVPIANRVFSPTDAEVARSRRLCQAYDEAERGGAGAASEGGRMIDAATYRIHKQVVDRAEQVAARDGARG